MKEKSTPVRSGFWSGWVSKPAARFSNLIQARRMCKNGCFWCCLLAEIRQPLIFQRNGSVCFNSLQERKSAWDSATQNEKTRTCGIPCAPIKANADWLPPSILSISLLALGCSFWKSCALGGLSTVPVPDVLSSAVYSHSVSSHSLQRACM